MNKRLTLTMLIAAGMAVSACAKKAPKVLPPDPGASQTQASASTAPLPGSQADFAAQMMGQDTIYFETDKFNIDATDQAALAAQAQWLMKYPAKRLTVEGHADERGTREYNLALGERRANAAKNYLVSLGIDAARLTTVSYGKERPRAECQEERCWSVNRRAAAIRRTATPAARGWWGGRATAMEGSCGTGAWGRDGAQAAPFVE